MGYVMCKQTVMYVHIANLVKPVSTGGGVIFCCSLRIVIQEAEAVKEISYLQCM